MFFSQKSKIRKDFQLRRLSLDSEMVDKKSARINQNFIDNFLPRILPLNNKILALYQPINNEVKLDLIKSFLIENNLSFSLPRIVKKNHHLNFVLINEKTEFKINNLYPKILEPESMDIIIPDIVITPLVAFDSKLSRIGMGLGFYDRTIKFLKNKNKIISVGLAYDFQKFDGVLETDEHDQTLDFIVTESEIL